MVAVAEVDDDDIWFGLGDTYYNGLRYRETDSILFFYFVFTATTESFEMFLITMQERLAPAA